MRNQATSCSRACIPYWTAALLAVGITIAVWPGFMSHDSLRQLREARHGVTGGYPTLPCYLWIPFDALWPGPAGMLTFQNGLLLAAVAHLLARATRWTARLRALLLVLFLLLPPLFGPMLVVWKDVGMAAFMATGAAALLHAETAETPRARRWALAAAFVCLGCGAAFRLNAFPAAIPLLLWMGWLTLPAAGRLAKLGSAALLALLILAATTALNTWRLPDGTLLPRPKNPSKAMVHDLVGISYRVRRVLLPPEFYAAHRDYSISDIDDLYLRHPGDLNPTRWNTDPAVRRPRLILDGSVDVGRYWRAAVSRYPLAYLRHRARVFAAMVGFHRRPVFYPTHGRIDRNDLGVRHRPTVLTHAALLYVNSASRTLLARSWVYYLLSFLAMAALLVRRPPRWHVPFLLGASGLLYLATFVPVVIAAELRFNCWPVAASALCVVLTVAALRQGSRQT